ncbi:hypothetical protein BC332_05210 [Capsicum chinense]|nr:hypothetical protein BC332_05210 [Capsicum chinense]
MWRPEGPHGVRLWKSIRNLWPKLMNKIVHNLSHALDIDARLARFEERSRHVLINDESVCDSCHARLGTKLFAMYPDDTIVCYKCFRRQGESTSVSGRDFKKDILYKPGVEFNIILQFWKSAVNSNRAIICNIAVKMTKCLLLESSFENPEPLGQIIIFV